MTSSEQELLVEGLHDIGPAVNFRVARRDVLGARGLLDFAATREGPHVPLTQVLVELLTNYHGYLAQLGPIETATLESLVPNTPSFRALSARELAEVNSEKERLLRLVGRVSIDPKQHLAFLFHQALYWLSQTDGFRVNYWTYQGIQALEMATTVTPSLQEFRSHLRSELLSALELVPRSARALRSTWAKSNYEGIEEFHAAVYAHGVSQADADAFLPRLDSVFRIGIVRSVH